MGNPAQALIAQKRPEHHKQHRCQKQQTDSQQEQENPIHISLENGIDGNGNHRRPAVVHLIVVNAPPVSVQIPDGGVELAESAAADSLQQLIRIGFRLLPGRLQIRHAVDHPAGAVKEKEGTSLRQPGVIFVGVKVVQKNVKSQHISGMLRLSRNGDQFPAGDGILIGVCKNRLVFRRHGLLIPFRMLVVIIPIPVPGVGGQNLPVHHRVGIHHMSSQNFV